MISGPYETKVKLLGLSTDTKPLNYLQGTEFFETDTGVSWLFTGADWIPYTREDVYTISSGIKSSSGVIIAVPGLLAGFSIITDGANTATLILYDNATTNSGTVIGKAIVLGANQNYNLAYNVPVKASNGIYMSLSGTGATAIVFYTIQ